MKGCFVRGGKGSGQKCGGVPRGGTVWVGHFGSVSLSCPYSSWDNGRKATRRPGLALPKPVAGPPLPVRSCFSQRSPRSCPGGQGGSGLATQLPRETETSSTSVCQAATSPLKIAALPPSAHPPCAGQAAGHSQGPCGLTWPLGRDWAPGRGGPCPEETPAAARQHFVQMSHFPSLLFPPQSR